MFGIKFPAIINCVILVILLVINGAGKLPLKLIMVLLINCIYIVFFIYWFVVWQSIGLGWWESVTWMNNIDE